MIHDHGYKILFSHSEFIKDLLTAFVNEPWVAALGFDSLEKVSGSYVSDDLRKREEDIVWRVRCREQWIYVYLLLEFQSTVDRYMAVRMLSYVGLLYQDLIRQQQLSGNGKLPPVFPVVIYNGERRWEAAEEIKDLLIPFPGGLERYQPQLRYLLLDEGRYATEELPERNLVAALFRFENCRETSGVNAQIRTLFGWLNRPEQEHLRRAFSIWLTRVFLPSRLPGVRIPELTTLQEVDSMLSESSRDWTWRWKEEGRAEGRQEGLQEGRQEGEATLILRLLERRFGPLDPAVQNRIQAADAETLLLWGERLLTAQRIEDIYGE